MRASEAILEQWIARTIASYPGLAAPFLSSEKDPFRTPVGHTLRQGLATLLQELLGDDLRGELNAERLQPALDAIIRIRAVQDLTPSQAVGFVFLLKPIVLELAPEHDPAQLHERIDRVALMAFDKYMQCREQLADIRVSEGRRRMHVRQVVG